jgi:hypothetical protein
VERGHSVWHRSSVLFTPKKYGKDWTRFLGIGFSAAALGFAISAVCALFGQFDNLADRTLAIAAFTAGAIIFGALGSDKWRQASEMPKDSRHTR